MNRLREFLLFIKIRIYLINNSFITNYISSFTEDILIFQEQDYPKPLL